MKAIIFYILGFFFIGGALYDIFRSLEFELYFVFAQSCIFLSLGILILPIIYKNIKKIIFSRFKNLVLEKFPNIYVTILIGIYILAAIILPLIPSLKEQIYLLEIKDKEQEIREEILLCFQDQLLEEGTLRDLTQYDFEELQNILTEKCLNDRTK